MTESIVIATYPKGLQRGECSGEFEDVLGQVTEGVDAAETIDQSAGERHGVEGGTELASEGGCQQFGRTGFFEIVGHESSSVGGLRTVEEF